MAIPEEAPLKPTPVKVGRTPLRKLFSFPVFLGTLLVAGVGAIIYGHLHELASLPAGASRPTIFEGDTWWHIAVGEQILSTHTWPTSDVYSFTARGSHWVSTEWLGEVGMALAARRGGLQGLAALLIGLEALLLLLVYCYAWLRSGSVKASLVACALLLPLAAASFTLRPQLLGYIFLSITFICLEGFRQGRRKALWVLPGIFLLWVNTHPTVIFGLLVLGVYWASGLRDFEWGGLVAQRWSGEQRRQLAVTSLLCVLVLTLTPYGTRLVGYMVEVAPSLPIILATNGEFQPIPFTEPYGRLLLVLLLAFLLAQVALRPSYRVEEFALLLYALYMTCAHRRYLPLLVVTFVPVLAVLLARWAPAYEAAKDRHVINGVAMALVVAGLVGLFPSEGELESGMAHDFPRAAVEYIRQHHLNAHMFNDDNWGGYLIWSLGREHSVFIDSRNEVYVPSGVYLDYLRIMQLHPDALELLHKYGVESCLLEREAPLATLLAASPDWELAYGDGRSVILVRKGSLSHASGAARAPAPDKP
jgi:hypothetical protein